MIITLVQMLDVVCKLDDAPDEDTPRERLRPFLTSALTEPDQARDRTPRGT